MTSAIILLAIANTCVLFIAATAIVKVGQLRYRVRVAESKISRLTKRQDDLRKNYFNIKVKESISDRMAD